MGLSPNKIFFLPKVPPKKTPMDKLWRAVKTTNTRVDFEGLYFLPFEVLMPKDDLDDPKYADWTLVQNTSYHKDWCTGKWQREFHWCRFQLDTKLSSFTSTSRTNACMAIGVTRVGRSFESIFIKKKINVWTWLVVGLVEKD